MSYKGFKLPSTITPINYELFFDVNLNKFKFSGEEAIELEIRKPTAEIILNTTDLEIKNVELVQKSGIIKPRVKLENQKELLVLTFNKKIKGTVKLFLKFAGKLNDNLLGFYRSKYSENKTEKYLATTQFEAPYARQCFPCFDEPEYKTTFDVTLKIDKNLRAISNMPIKEEKIDGDKKTVRFHRTPKMSTYLLYFGVGEFEFLEGKLDKTLIRIVTTPGKKNQAKFALDLTKKFLSYFQEYSGIRYPLPKLDMIALPDFAAGAMENWGAITFREIYLLFDPKITSTSVKKRIAMIIAHELWHQWSGDLVTMRWWDDLWLNESFATFMAYKAVDHIFPEWNMWEDFIRDETERAFDDDSLRTTHPIEVEVKDPRQIEEIFDAISYSKGGSVLRMFESYLGEETFRKGVVKYLSDNKYSNATSEDLWDSLSKVSNKPIKEIIIDWVKKAGYPFVEARLENHMLMLKQKKFVFNQSKNTLWRIPLVIKSNGNILTEILDKADKKIPLQNTEWLKLNYNQSGFYRVKYSDEFFSRLEQLVSKKDLPSLDRWGIQDDLFAFSQNGIVDLSKYLDLIKYYENENSYLVLSSINSNIRSIYFVFCQQNFWSRIWTKFNKHFTKPFEEILDKLSWEPKENESQKEALLRELSIKYLAFMGNKEVLKRGLDKFKEYLDKAELHPDVKSAIFYIVAITGDEKTYEKLVEIYSKTQSPEEKRILLISLGQFRDPNTLKKFLDFSLTDKVRVQDLPIVFSSVAANPNSRHVLLQWLKKNWKKVKSYEKSGKIFINILESFISSFASRDKESELREFFNTHRVKYKMTINRALEKMRRNIVWFEKNNVILSQYFGVK